MDPIKHKDDTLPETAELGDEGGSYAEPMNQRATFGKAARPNVADERSRRSRAEARDIAARAPFAGDAGEDEPRLKRNSSEEPQAHDLRETLALKARGWQKGLVGVAAGTAALIGVARLRRRT